MANSPSDERSRFEARLFQNVQQLLATTAGCTKIVVAYSGGRDSTALLHALVALRTQLDLEFSACHVDHGLQAESLEWAAHCTEQCASLEIPLVLARLAEVVPKAASIEAWAREQRYALFAQYCDENTLLVTAHHADDQAETFLMNALRGSGPEGLQGIAPLRRCGRGWLGRPLLVVSAEEIASYAQLRGLDWITDPSNQSLRFRRNVLRQQILPRLRATWPAGNRSLARSASLQRESALALTQAGAQLLRGQLTVPSQLSCTFLESHPPALRAVLLRHWLSVNGCPSLPTRKMTELLRQITVAESARQPTMLWSGMKIRRFRDTLYLMREGPSMPTDFTQKWTIETPLELPWGSLRGIPTIGNGLRANALADGMIELRRRRGGERIRFRGHAHHRSVKHLLQESSVPPWQRMALPLIYIDNRLAAIPNLGVSEEYAASESELGFVIEWLPNSA